MRSTATITIRSHGFSVTDYNGEFYRHLTDYCRKFVKTKMMSSVAGGRRVMKQVPDRVFASATNNRRELRFHINVLKEFYSFMQQRGYNTSRFKTIKDMPEQGHDKPMEFKSPDVQPRPHQVDYVAYQLDRNKDGVTTKINTLQTGKGKTFCAIYNMVKLEKLTVVVLMPKYILTWLTGLDDFVKLNAGDVMVVQGSAELNGCMKLAEENKLDAKIVIVSLPTLQYFMSEYEDTNGKMKGYTHTPDEFWKLLNPGFLIVDEGHESIHALFKLDLYTNVMNKLVLSATLEADDEFINDIYYVIYPNSMRFKNGEYDKYIESIALMYGLQNPNLVKFKGFGGAYSHVKFEQSIIKNKKLLWSWLEFNRTVFEHLFIRKKEDGMRCLIYCATVEMCLLVASHLTEAYPELDIRKFTQEDPKETLYEADCSVSTLKSAGTGVDIAELFCVICTVAIGSKQQSNQSLGRLRRLKSFPDAVPRYCYLTCTGIKQHMDYHRRKVATFANKTLSQKEVNSGFSL